MMHIFATVFFILLILYSLLWNNIEGLEGGCNNQDVISKTNANEIEKIKKEMEELKGIKNRVESIEAETKLVSDGIQKMKESDKQKK